MKNEKRSSVSKKPYDRAQASKKDERYTENHVKEGDWFCEKCNKHNFSKRNECVQCAKPRGNATKVSRENGESHINMSIMVKMGDWYCGKCNSHNFAKREACFRCMKERGSDDENVIDASKLNRNSSDKSQYTYPKNVRQKRGDWTCPNRDCRASNFASRKLCFQCETEKPPQPDEWECDACGYQNLNFRIECKECGVRNKNPSTEPMREGDWVCKCGHYNFKRRNECQECKAGKQKTDEEENQVF